MYLNDRLCIVLEVLPSLHFLSFFFVNSVTETRKESYDEQGNIILSLSSSVTALATLPCSPSLPIPHSQMAANSLTATRTNGTSLPVWDSCGCVVTVSDLISVGRPVSPGIDKLG